MSDVVVAGTVRTAMGRFGRALKKFTAAELGGPVGREALRRAHVDPEDVDEVVVSNARQAGTGPNLGRQLVPRSGVPLDVPGYTVNMACGSGIKAVELAAETIRNKSADCVLVIGVEAMSRIPYLLDGARWGYKLGNSTVHDALHKDGFICALSDQHMGLTAENLAEEYEIPKKESDRFAIMSHRRAVKAAENGEFESQILSLQIAQKRGPDLQFAVDECPRPDTSLEKVSQLPPVFKDDGQITAGNASAIADGAAALVAMSEEFAREREIPAGLKLLGLNSAGVDPNRMGIGPVPAVRQLLDRLNFSVDEFAAIELNEAFAVQVLACLRELQLQPEDVNPQGGAVALGHPIGMTGIRMLVALDHYLNRDQYGLATMCVNGGMGLAAAVCSLR